MGDGACCHYCRKHQCVCVHPSVVDTAHQGDWGWLQGEPCRFCREIGKVYFLIDEGPEGRDGKQVMRCDHCKRSWVSEGVSA